MGKLIDSYSFRARVLPIYLVVAPVILLVAAFAPAGLQLPLGSGAAIVFVPIAFLFSQLGGVWGKRLEPRLWQKWGGPPTTRFLRHGNPEFNSVTRQVVHGTVRRLKLEVPTAAIQAQSPDDADEQLAAATLLLIRKTRNKDAYPLVYKGLVDYGFCRNALGLKPLALCVATASLVGILVILITGLLQGVLQPIPIVAALVALGLLAVWALGITERLVHQMAKRYARFLFEAALELE